MNDPSAAKRDVLWLAGMLGLLVVVALARPLLPIDETRYASVAWEMWARGDFLVPFRNGEAYHHKPPLLFWLMHAGWWIFGVNEWWPRLISPLFAAGTVALTHALGRRLWPQRPEVARIASFVLLSSLLFAYFATALMFDTMLSFFVALGLLGIVVAWQDGGRRGFVWLALGLGGALYAKGPVALLHLMPAAVFAPWWMRERQPRWGRWSLGVVLALLGGAALILAWAIPAAIAGGPEYRNAIFWGQTAGRMTSSFAHRAPVWFYLAWLPLMLLPWLLWPRWWRGLRRTLLAESGFRLALLVVLVCLASFSLISGKRWHYLLPEFAVFALIVARAAADTRGGRWTALVPALGLAAAGLAAIFAAPQLGRRLGGLDDTSALVWGGVAALACCVGLLSWRPTDALRDVRRIALASILAYAALLAAVDVALREPYDVSAVAHRLAQLERDGHPVAIEGDYHGQWHLAGRLRRPLEEIDPGTAAAWLSAHPGGRVILTFRRPEDLPRGLTVEYTRLYRGNRLAIVAGS